MTFVNVFYKLTVILLAFVTLFVSHIPADARWKDGVRTTGTPFCYKFGLLCDCKTGICEGQDAPKSRKKTHQGKSP